MSSSKMLVSATRAGEGEPITGLKPSGYDVGPAIPGADRALESASSTRLPGCCRLRSTSRSRSNFNEVLAARAAMTEGDVRSGRAYVKAYVEFMHYVERLHEAATAEVHGLHDGDAVEPQR